MPDQTYNPIKRVRAKPTEQTPNPKWATNLPVPSKYDWKLSDVSAADAGRTEDALMHKMLVAQKVHLELEWQNVVDSDSQKVLAAFNHEYIEVQFFDYKTNAFSTKTFYVGDRSVRTYSRRLGLSTLSFNIIEQ